MAEKDNCCSSDESQDSNPCCPQGKQNDIGESYSPARGSSSTPRIKIVVFALVVGAALAVAGFSIVRNSPVETEEPTEKLAANDTPTSAMTALPGTHLTFLKDFGKLDANTEAVFVFLPGESEESSQTVSRNVNAAVGQLTRQRKRVETLTVQKGTAEYDQLVRKFSVKSLPCVIVAGQGCQPLKLTDDITEDRLLRAFVRASCPASFCGKRSGKSGCCP